MGRILTKKLMFWVFPAILYFGTHIQAEPMSAIEFHDTTASVPTCRFGYFGTLSNGHFFIENPVETEVFRIEDGDVSVPGSLTADRFIGDGSQLINLPTLNVDIQDKLDSLGTLISAKADKSALDQKASISALSSKADTTELRLLESQISGKANVSELAAKADTLALKSLSATVSLKANSSELANKADVSALNGKADTGSVYTRSALSGLLSDKADISGSSFTGSVSVEGNQNRSFTVATNGLNFVDLILRRSSAGSAYDVEWKQHIDYTPNLQFRATTTANGTKYPLTLSPEGSVAIGKTNVNNTYALDVAGEAYKSMGGSTWVTPSDRRLKKDIERVDLCLTKLTKLRAVHFRWKEPANHGNDTTLQTGLIAQEVEEVFPDWVGESDNGFKTLQPKGFEAIVAEAFKEVTRRIEALEKENAELRSEIEAIRGQGE